MDRVAIVGGGLAGARSAQALREQGYTGATTLVAAEQHLPYDRPPLSKAVLLGTEQDSTLAVDWDALDVQLLLGRRATGLTAGPAGAEVAVDGEAALDADAVVLATGSVPVTVPGAETVPGAHVLRTVEDAHALRAALRPGARVVVVGAGWIGAEVATAAAVAGCAVTVLEAAASPLAGALPVEVAGRTARWYDEAGVDLQLGVTVSAVLPGEVHVSGPTGDEVLRFDVAVVGVGVRPATDWLAGSAVSRDPRGAVLVDAALRTDLPGVFAVGDCCTFPSGRYGVRLRTEHWDEALRAPDVVAANLLGGDQVHDPVPYIWSEQFGRTLGYVGRYDVGAGPTWRGDPDANSWTACWLDADDRLAAAVTVDRPRDLVQARRLAARGARLDRALLADPDVALRTAVAG